MFERHRRAFATAPASEPSGVSGQHVLAFLTDQRLDATPANYELAYVYRTNRDGIAARAIDAILMEQGILTEKQADEIFTTHIRPPVRDDGKERGEMSLHALRLSDIAADALIATGQFGRDLAGGLDGLGKDEPAISATVLAMIEHSSSTERALAKAASQIEELRQEVQAARSDAARDALTGLSNRRGIEEHARRLDQQSAVVAICDIDRFKSVNDRYGHVVGDRVLKLVATSLVESCAPHAVGRWGGEEFLVVMAGLSVEQCVAVLDKARGDLGERHVRLRTTDEPLGRITFSAGVAAMKARPLAVTVDEADKRLYRAKAEGRDRVVHIGD